MAVSREQLKYKLDSVGVQVDRLVGGGNEPAGGNKFFYGYGMRIMNYIRLFYA
jgi:hypothetical protein